MNIAGERVFSENEACAHSSWSIHFAGRFARGTKKAKKHTGPEEMTTHKQDGELSREVQGSAEEVFLSINLFASLKGEEVREMMRSCEQSQIKPGEMLFRQGDSAEALFIVARGELEVSANTDLGEKVVLAVLGSGTVVGEMSLIEGGPRSATVEAVSECEVFRLSRESFEAMRKARRPAAYKIILGLAATVGERRRQTDARIEEVFQDPEAHIDSFESQLNDMLGRLRKS